MLSHFPRFSSPSGNPECAKFASLILKADMNYKFLCYHSIMITHGISCFGACFPMYRYFWNIFVVCTCISPQTIINDEHDFLYPEHIFISFPLLFIFNYFLNEQ